MGASETTRGEKSNKMGGVTLVFGPRVTHGKRGKKKKKADTLLRNLKE